MLPTPSMLPKAYDDISDLLRVTWKCKVVRWSLWCARENGVPAKWLLARVRAHCQSSSHSTG